MKNIIFALLTIMSTSVYAGSCSSMISKIDGMSSEQRQAMIVACETTKLQEKGVPSIERVGEWAEISKSFAEAIGIAAKELGVATNEFLFTPAGKLTAGVIIWKVMGDQLMAFVIGVPLLIFVIILYIRFTRRILKQTIEYDRYPVFGGAFTRTRVKKVEQGNLNEEHYIAMLVSTLISTFLVIIIVFNMF